MKQQQIAEIMLRYAIAAIWQQWFKSNRKVELILMYACCITAQSFQLRFTDLNVLFVLCNMFKSIKKF